MKKLLFSFAVIALLSFGIKMAEEKTYTFKFTEKELNTIWRQLSQVNQYMDQTNLPHAEVKWVQAKVDSVMGKIYVQYKAQADTTKK
jgi:hypothetical protein